MVRVEVLPARAAYLISEGSRDGLRRAVQEASTRWGGIAEPVVPVCSDGEVDGWWRQVVETVGVEGLVDVDAGASHAQQVSKSFDLPVTALVDIDRSGPTRFTVHPSALDGSERPVLRTPVVSRVGGPLWQTVLAGDFTDEHEATLGEALYRREPGEDQIVRAALWGQTFLDRTVVGFAENEAEDLWPTPALVWVAGDDDFLDCVWFWNMRVLRSISFEPCPMVLVPAAGPENWLGLERDLAAQLSRTSDFAPDVSIMSTAVPEATLRELAEQVLGLHPSEEALRTGRRMPSALRTPPFTYRVNLELRDLLTFSRRYGKVREVEVYADDGRAQVRIQSPVEFTGGGRVLLRLASPLLDGLPAKDVLAAKVMPGAVSRGRSVQIATHAMNSYNLELAVPSSAEAMDALIRTKAQWAMSEKGRLAATLIDSTDLSSLLQPSVYEAINHLTTPRATAYKREMEQMRASGLSESEIDEFSARWGGRGERRYDSAQGFIRRVGKRTVAPVDALEMLCSVGWAERGFETDCARCGIRSFVSFETAETAARCPGCRAASTYTTTHDSVIVHYRLNTLIDRASDQGVVPHLLVIGALAERDPYTDFLGGVLTTFGDGTLREVDVIGIHGQRYVGGEVKSKALDFTPTQLARDFDTSSRLGVDVHLLAAVDEIPNDIQHSAEALAEAANLQLIILSKTHLRPVR